MSATLTPAKQPVSSEARPQPDPTRRWRNRIGRFFRIAGIAVLVLLLLYVGFIVAFHGWYDRWGATDAEVHATLPGDRLVAHPTDQSTMAITIHAPPSVVWPWLVQMDRNKAAFYSHTWAENLFGQNMHNADQIHPEWQNLKVGDTVNMGTMGPAKLELVVREMQHNRALIFEWKQGKSLGGTWQFVLNPAGQNTTRLLLRGRAANEGFADRYIWGYGMGPISFFMDHGMLNGIKDRAEHAWSAHPAG